MMTTKNLLVFNRQIAEPNSISTVEKSLKMQKQKKCIDIVAYQLIRGKKTITILAYLQYRNCVLSKNMHKSRT